MVYEWLESGLRALRGLEPGDVVAVLSSARRRPIRAVSEHGHQLLSIWGRTTNGRGVIVGVRQLSRWDWQIIGARMMTDAEDAQHRAWEAEFDE